MQPFDSRAERRPVTFWWFLLPLLSFGLFACVPPFIAASWLRSKWLVAAGFGYIAVMGLLCSLAVSPGTDTRGDVNPGALYALVYLSCLAVGWGGGTAHAVVLQRQVRRRYGQRPQPGPAQPALVAARERMRRRAESRALLASDPVLASELKIGRPDLNPGYDDGGLVDINHVPAATLVAALDMGRELAEQVVVQRGQLGGFSTVEELIVYCEGLSPQRAEFLRDRLVFLPI